MLLAVYPIWAPVGLRGGATLSFLSANLQPLANRARINLFHQTSNPALRMNLVQLNNQVSVSDQITVDDIAELKNLGVELLVCNRPDDEDVGQTPFADIKMTAEAAGLKTALLAFSSYQITNQSRDQLVALINTHQKIHLYCRSGSRSRRLWRSANKIGCGGHDYR